MAPTYKALVRALQPKKTGLAPACGLCVMLLRSLKAGFMLNGGFSTWKTEGYIERWVSSFCQVKGNQPLFSSFSILTPSLLFSSLLLLNPKGFVFFLYCLT